MLSSSPIGKVDYDVLQEIFVHCLPEYALTRFEWKRSNMIKDAPLLLCQVCSSWRAVALVSAKLWSHLYYSLTICTIQEGDRLESKLLAREVEFLQWWRKNQRTVPLFLRLSVKGGYHQAYSNELAQRGMDFVLEYAASAHYLELSPFFWGEIYKRSKAGDVFMPSRLHTLVRHRGDSRTVEGFRLGYTFFESQMLFPPHTLRRLAIGEYIPGPERNIIPVFWSTLTHMSIGEIHTNLSYWYTLLRGLPKLEWAHFSIEEENGFQRWDLSNIHIILPHLSTLYLAMYDSEQCRPHIPFSALFAYVHLPALHTLALSWYISHPGHIYSIAAELSAILKSVPTVTTLTLADEFLEIAHPAPAPIAFDAEDHEEPIWKHAAHVAELRLEARGCTKRMQIWDMLFTEGKWLDLQDLACPVRVVTISDRSLRIVEHDIGESDEDVMARSPIKRELAEKAPNIVFRFTSQSETTMIDHILEEWKECM